MLVCCQGGKVRSIHAKWLLNDKYGYKNLVTIGLENTDESLKAILCEWADIILIVATDNLREKVPEKYRDKIELLFVGPDVWGKYPSKELLKKLTPMMEKFVNKK